MHLIYRDKSKKYCEQSAAIVCIKLLADDKDCPRPLPELQSSAVGARKDDCDSPNLKRDRAESSLDTDSSPQSDAKRTAISHDNGYVSHLQDKECNGSQKHLNENIERDRTSAKSLNKELERSETDNHSNSKLEPNFCHTQTKSEVDGNNETSLIDIDGCYRLV